MLLFSGAHTSHHILAVSMQQAPSIVSYALKTPSCVDEKKYELCNMNSLKKNGSLWVKMLEDTFVFVIRLCLLTYFMRFVRRICSFYMPYKVAYNVDNFIFYCYAEFNRMWLDSHVQIYLVIFNERFDYHLKLFSWHVSF